MGHLSLGDWIEQQAAHSAVMMEKAISATHLRKERAGFGQVIVPVKGSVLASPDTEASWNPDPDYFFDWSRDSAHIMDVVTLLSRFAATTAERDHWNDVFQDIVGFNLIRQNLDGSVYFTQNDFRKSVHDDHKQWVRPDDLLFAIKDGRAMREPRINPDGTLSFVDWSHAQLDGSALRALAGMRHASLCLEQGRAPSLELEKMIETDLDFTVKHAGEICAGPWEEKPEDHPYYTGVAQLGALFHGAQWAAARRDALKADLYLKAALALEKDLEDHWSGDFELYTAYRTSSIHHTGPVACPEDGLDTANIMIVSDAELSGRHGLFDDRVHSTLAQLEHMFALDYPINLKREPGLGVAFGRYRGDRYFSGGAYYFMTEDMATFYYRLAYAVLDSDEGLRATALNAGFREMVSGLSGAADKVVQAKALAAHGDGIMAMVRKYTPENGSQRAVAMSTNGDGTQRIVREWTPKNGTLSEQFDKVNGKQTSCKQQTWSYSSFIQAALMRRQIMIRLDALAPKPSSITPAPAP